MLLIFKKKKKNINNKKKLPSKGFSLIEVLVALLAFSILTSAVAGVYMGFLEVQIKSKESQRNLENGQLALNSLAKSLRTAKIISPNTSSVVSTIRFFDYSKVSVGNACLEYRVSGGNLEMKSASLTEGNCTAAANLGPSYVSLINGRVYGGFLVTLPGTTSTGKVTVSLQICPKGSTTCNATSNDSMKIQTSVALRVN